MDINILVSLPPNANDHSQLTSLSPDVKPCDNHAQYRAYTITKALTCYEIGQQADYNHRLERLLIETSVIPSLLCPTDGY
jgi:hypothetical protein